MSDEDKCNHPASALVVTMVSFNRDVREMWIAPHKCITVPGKTHMIVDTRCALCGELVQLTGDYDAPG
jgi:hypothetical protein